MNPKEQAAHFPSSPGVYLMKDGKGRVLYVGKASDLKKRITSYFGKEEKGRYQVRFLMRRVQDLDFVVTGSEKEALLLENTLIKKYRPKYNIQLRDDKSYLSANRIRPCLQYQIHRCDAPCVGSISEEAYQKVVDQVRLLLQGRKGDLLSQADKEMTELSGREEFEKAAKARDLIRSIKETLEKQSVARHRSVDQDAIGFYREGERVTLCVIEVREGKVWESRLYHLKNYQDDVACLEEFLNQFYGEGRFLPDEILLPLELENGRPFTQVLEERRGRPVSLLSPQSGDRSDLVRFARKNAEEGFRRREAKQEEIGEILDRLQTTLRLQNLPRRVECFDISNLGGKQAVGSLVCFVNGEPFKEGYRRFRIKTVSGPDDFSMMKEVLRRRLLRGEGEGEKEEKWERPDMILIDGGKGQLSVMMEAVEELNVTGIDIAALAKARPNESADKVYLPGRKNPVRLKPRSSLLHLLMRIRDEAHRFAIAYHKKLRRKAFLPASIK
ncbi:MAG: excinuclease ABC subunit C [Deltaproteobacteria bacterium]|nr:excinuclease ABC subunit C [Deltaproteobacteria bacterium]